MKTKSPYLNYISDYMVTKQYSPRTINNLFKAQLEDALGYLLSILKEEGYL
ncbi:hypothetical protein ACOYR1_13205 [Thalassotalea piscium]